MRAAAKAMTPSSSSESSMLEKTAMSKR